MGTCASKAHPRRGHHIMTYYIYPHNTINYCMSVLTTSLHLFRSCVTLISVCNVSSGFLILIAKSLSFKSLAMVFDQVICRPPSLSSCWFKGIIGGVQVENEVSSDSKNSDYVLSGTFYGIEKACRVVVQCCREVGTYSKILYVFGLSIISIAKLGKPFLLTQKNFLSRIFDQFVSFHDLSKCTWEFNYFCYFGPLFRAQS